MRVPCARLRCCHTLTAGICVLVLAVLAVAMLAVILVPHTRFVVTTRRCSKSFGHTVRS